MRQFISGLTRQTEQEQNFSKYCLYQGRKTAKSERSINLVLLHFKGCLSYFAFFLQFPKILLQAEFYK